MDVNEIWFDMESSGFLPDYGFQGGPGRAVFDKETHEFKRMEPLGGMLAAGILASPEDPHATQPLIESDAPEEQGG